MNGRSTVLAFGEILWDLLPTGAVLGGAPANFAYRLNSLGDYCVLVSRLGRDALGRQAVSQLTALGATVAAQAGATGPISTAEFEAFLRADHARLVESSREAYRAAAGP